MVPAMAITPGAPPTRTPAQRFANIVGMCPVVVVHSGATKHFRVLYDMLNSGYKIGAPLMVDLAALDNDWKKAVERRSNAGLPQVWLGGECHGSYEDMMKLHRSGALREMLRDLAAEQLSVWQRDARRNLGADAPKQLPDAREKEFDAAEQPSNDTGQSEASDKSLS